MLYREIGNTGVKLSEIGFGCGGSAVLMVNGTAEQQRDAIARAIELGINYFDTSGHYGDGASETNLGLRLKELGVRPYITTKVEVRNHNLGDIAGHVMLSLDESLERMGVDYVDFLQIHNGPVTQRPDLQGAAYNVLWEEDYLRPGGALEGLQRAQEAGKTRFIGFISRGNDFTPCQHLIDTGVFHLINVSVNLVNPVAGVHPYGMKAGPDAFGLLEYAGAHGVGSAIYSPLAGGIVTDNMLRGGPPHPVTRPVNEHAVEIEGQTVRTARERGNRDEARHKAQALGFLSRPGQDLALAGLRFVLSLAGVTTALGGFSDVHQVEENVAASGLGPLSIEDMARLEMIWRANFGLS